MSEAAAKIIRILSKHNSVERGAVLGTIISVSPLKVKFDGIDFELSSGLLINNALQIKPGDRVVGISVSGTQYAILCKVVSA